MSTWRMLTSFFISPERKRLRAEIGVLSKQLSGQTGKRSELLAMAETEQTSGDMDAGWKYLHEARRLGIMELGDPDLAILRKSLLTECQAKLGGWRLAAVESLIAKDFDAIYPETGQRRSALYSVMTIRDEAYDNTYHKMRVIRGQMLLLLPVLTALLAGFLVLARYAPDICDFRPESLTSKGALTGMVLGAIGACLSALTSFAAASPDKPIPATVTSLGITIIRPIIGATSGLIAVLVLLSGIIALDLNVTACMIIAVTFGFSERLVIGTLSRISGEAEKIALKP